MIDIQMLMLGVEHGADSFAGPWVWVKLPAFVEEGQGAIGGDEADEMH